MNIAVFGAQGRVGSKVVEIAQKRGHNVWKIDKKILKQGFKCDENSKNTLFSENFQGTNGFSAKNCTFVNDLVVTSDLHTEKEREIDLDTDKIDVVIDFATAEATSEVCEFCKIHQSALVSGVTGRNDEQLHLVEQLSETVPVICKANFSVGVEMLHRICQIVASKLADWDCEIVETHRKGKVDSPSGTAKSLAGEIVEQKSFRKVTVHSLRCGSNFGRHSVVFATQGESLTLTHQAENVEIFAKGAILEAEKLVAKRQIAQQNNQR